MAVKKAFLLRLDPGVWEEIERLAQSELRSVNGQIEFLLRRALAERGIAPHNDRRTPAAEDSTDN
jgi:hypothetical protein